MTLVAPSFPKRRLTPLGHAMRQVRIERWERLLDWAERLGLACYELCNIEFGRLPVPEGFVERLIAEFKLSDEHAEALRMSEKGGEVYDATIKTI